MKKPMTANIQAINIKIKPRPNKMISIDPHRSKLPAVANECSPDFCASVSNVLFKCEEARRKNTKATTSTTKKITKPAANPAVNTKFELNVKLVAVPTPMTIAVTDTAAAISAIM